MAIANLDTTWLQHALRFNYYYVTNLNFRNHVEQLTAQGLPVYQGKSTNFFIQTLIIHSERYSQLYKLTQNAKDRIYTFLYYCLRDSKEYARLANIALEKIQTQVIKPPIYPRISTAVVTGIAVAATQALSKKKKTPKQAPTGKLTPREIAQVKQELLQYEATTGKQIRYVENKSHPIHEPAAIKKLDEIIARGQTNPPPDRIPILGTTTTTSTVITQPARPAQYPQPIQSVVTSTSQTTTTTNTKTKRGIFNSGIGSKKSKLIYTFAILFMLTFLAAFTFISDDDDSTALNNQPGTPVAGNPAVTSNDLEIQKTGPVDVQNGDEILYTLTIKYNGTGTADVLITDPLPQNADFISATDGGELENGTVKWTLPALPSNQTYTVQMRVRATMDNIWLQNTAEASVISSNQGPTFTTPTRGGTNPATPDNCGGKYNLNNPIGNFGDPLCNFTKDELYNALKNIDPNEADYWFYTVVPCESSYNPNAYFASSPAAGAYGLFQMGSGLGGVTDSGNTEWIHQVNNAVAHSRVLRGKSINPWTYWQCAEGRW